MSAWRNPASEDKVVPLAEAIAEIDNGMTVAIGGTYLTDEPIAAAHELIRQDKRHLDLVLTEGACLAGDLLIGAGCVDSVMVSTLGFMRLGAIAPRFRHAVEEGRIRVREVEQNHVHAALRASAQGLPFMPTLSGLGCDYASVNPDILTIQDPFDGASVTAVRALQPDVMIVHTKYSDAAGNAQHGGSLHYDVIGCRASANVIVMTERVVSKGYITRNPHATHVIGYNVRAVCETPFGCYPSEAEAVYTYDLDEYREYLRAAQNSHDFDEYVSSRIRRTASWEEYLEKWAGWPRLAGNLSVRL